MANVRNSSINRTLIGFEQGINIKTNEQLANQVRARFVPMANQKISYTDKSKSYVSVLVPIKKIPEDPGEGNVTLSIKSHNGKNIKIKAIEGYQAKQSVTFRATSPGYSWDNYSSLALTGSKNVINFKANTSLLSASRVDSKNYHFGLRGANNKGDFALKFKEAVDLSFSLEDLDINATLEVSGSNVVKLKQSVKSEQGNSKISLSGSYINSLVSTLPNSSNKFFGGTSGFPRTLNSLTGSTSGTYSVLPKYHTDLDAVIGAHPEDKSVYSLFTKGMTTTNQAASDLCSIINRSGGGIKAKVLYNDILYIRQEIKGAEGLKYGESNDATLISQIGLNDEVRDNNFSFSNFKLNSRDLNENQFFDINLLRNQKGGINSRTGEIILGYIDNDQHRTWVSQEPFFQDRVLDENGNQQEPLPALQLTMDQITNGLSGEHNYFVRALGPPIDSQEKLNTLLSQRIIDQVPDPDQNPEQHHPSMRLAYLKLEDDENIFHVRFSAVRYSGDFDPGPYIIRTRQALDEDGNFNLSGFSDLDRAIGIQLGMEGKIISYFDVEININGFQTVAGTPEFVKVKGYWESILANLALAFKKVGELIGSVSFTMKSGAYPDKNAAESYFTGKNWYCLSFQEKKRITQFDLSFYKLRKDLAISTAGLEDQDTSIDARIFSPLINVGYWSKRSARKGYQLDSRGRFYESSLSYEINKKSASGEITILNPLLTGVSFNLNDGENIVSFVGSSISDEGGVPVLYKRINDSTYHFKTNDLADDQISIQHASYRIWKAVREAAGNGDIFTSAPIRATKVTDVDTVKLQQGLFLTGSNSLITKIDPDNKLQVVHFTGGESRVIQDFDFRDENDELVYTRPNHAVDIRSFGMGRTINEQSIYEDLSFVGLPYDQSAYDSGNHYGDHYEFDPIHFIKSDSMIKFPSQLNNAGDASGYEFDGIIEVFPSRSEILGRIITETSLQKIHGQLMGTYNYSEIRDELSEINNFIDFNDKKPKPYSDDGDTTTADDLDYVTILIGGSLDEERRIYSPLKPPIIEENNVKLSPFRDKEERVLSSLPLSGNNPDEGELNKLVFEVSNLNFADEENLGIEKFRRNSGFDFSSNPHPGTDSIVFGGYRYV